ncbi:MAG TPA: methyl-accepting chemotaxis protein [Ramlibacter sp.]|jgi:methyl-accepting chemotaxis protein|uniref:methyl-accepting chemotaxis protein n=1 Tax=Ramlibacter sp. TaxID=1917967 RepID=UPI002D39562D|nr:methyl-accepting chemotaxis protein [Ramlibacter sp.]HZY19173.1 methyl-accepting chemotaxis protein [Ramlibacter sp.]
MNRLGLRGRLALAFGLLLLLLLVVAGVGMRQLDNTRRLDAREAGLTQLRHEASQWSALTRLNVVRAVALAKVGSPPHLAAWMDGEIKQTSARISEYQKQLDTGLEAIGGKPLIEAVGSARKSYLELRGGLLKRLADPATAPAAAADVDGKLVPAADGYLRSLDAVVAHVDKELADSRRAREESMRAAGILLPVVALLALLLGGALAWWLSRSVTVPVRQAQAVAQRIAAGDLTQPVPVQGRDELGQLLAALDGMQQNLRSMVGGIRAGTDSVGAATAQIASGNQDLSERTERAAAALQQTASTLSSLSRATQAASGSANEAQALAAQALEIARRGGEMVGRVVSTMQEINTGSSRIGEITGVIDAIAFQTNMLALNAAVEAARAGEQGRGFAVVAGEVRNLAGRCAEAAREIRGLIDASVAKVEDGTRLVGDAGTTMQQIERSVRQVTEAVGGVSVSSAAQAGDVGEVNQAVAQLDGMTQQNAALVEEAAAAAQSLRDQAVSLGRLVSTFRVPAAA